MSPKQSNSELSQRRGNRQTIIESQVQRIFEMLTKEEKKTKKPKGKFFFINSINLSSKLHSEECSSTAPNYSYPTCIVDDNFQ